MEKTTSKKPLEGIRVIDLTRVLAGPFCTMILKNLGAEVIKIERPPAGDEARFIGPFFGENGSKSAYFMSVNAGKKSLALHLGETKGKEILTGLLRISDILVENFRPGVFKRLGFSRRRIEEINPDLIYAAVSGFGHSGPDTQRPAFDMIIQALSGIISITGPEDGPQTRVGTSISDIVAGMFAAIGILSALYRRSISRGGAMIDVAMLDSTVAILENAIVRYQAAGNVPGPIGTRHPSATPFGSFKTRDSEIVITAWTDRFFADLCVLLGRPELKDDDRFKTNDLRTLNVKALTEIVNGVLATDTTEQWMKKLEKLDIPCAKVNTIEDLFRYDQIHERNMLVPVDGEEPFRIAGNPVKIVGVPDDGTAGPYPKPGEHTEAILRDLLGYKSEDIERFRRDGIIGR
ncbi:MAG: CoA transferase [Deltaproteobacteria bacterium]|nr:CoA transferase [Deltaproteobacteria bacterium]